MKRNDGNSMSTVMRDIKRRLSGLSELNVLAR